MPNIRQFLATLTDRRPGDLFSRVQAAAHDAATSPYNRDQPTAAQLEANSYRTGRVDIQGLPVRIENPRGTRREKPGRWSNLMQHHYGDIAGTKGNDGDPVDVFIGPFPELTVVYVVNQVGRDGAFDEHKVCIGFPSEADARTAYLSAYAPGWDGLASITRATVTQLKWWLKFGDKSRPFTPDVLPYEGQTTMDKVLWNAQAEPVTKPLHTLMYELRVEDAEAGLMLDAVSMAEQMTDPDIEAMPLLDAMVVEVGRLQPKMEALQRIMAAAGGTVKPTEVSISDPVRYRGVAQVMVVFSMDDGQTVSVWFHNPDTTPAKLMPLDELISWKWMLNKKDVTIVVAPEKGRDLNPREVARRMMRLVERNTEAFKKANARTAERAALLQSLDTEIAGLEGTLADLNRKIEVAKVSREDRFARDMRGLIADQDRIFKLLEKEKAGARDPSMLQSLFNQADDIADEIRALKGIDKVGRESWDQWQALRAAEAQRLAESEPHYSDLTLQALIENHGWKAAYFDGPSDSGKVVSVAREFVGVGPLGTTITPDGMRRLSAGYNKDRSRRRYIELNLGDAVIGDWDGRDQDPVAVAALVNDAAEKFVNEKRAKNGLPPLGEEKPEPAEVPAASFDDFLAAVVFSLSEKGGMTPADAKKLTDGTNLVHDGFADKVPADQVADQILAANKRSPNVERAYRIAERLIAFYGWSKSAENDYPEQGINLDAPRDSDRWVFLGEQNGRLIAEKPSTMSFNFFTDESTDAELAANIDLADFEAELDTGVDGLLGSDEEFAGKTVAFAYAAEVLRKGATAAGAMVQFGDFNGSTSASMFDKATNPTPYADVSVYGITAQIGVDGQVLARASIDEDGNIVILKGAGGTEEVGTPADAGDVREFVKMLMAEPAAQPVVELAVEPVVKTGETTAIMGVSEGEELEDGVDPIAAVDAAYKFDDATDEFKRWVADSIEEAEYSPFVSSKSIDEAAKKHGARVSWDIKRVMDSISGEEPPGSAGLLDSATGKKIVIDDQVPMKDRPFGVKQVAFVSWGTGNGAMLVDIDREARAEFGGGTFMAPAGELPGGPRLVRLDPKAMTMQVAQKADGEMDWTEPVKVKGIKVYNVGKFTGAFRVAALDDVAANEDDDFDPEAEFDSCPEDEEILDGMILDGDFKGHPFRGNQYKEASNSSRSAVYSSMQAKHAEKNGDKASAGKAHWRAAFQHASAMKNATGKAVNYHKKMAIFHGGKSGMEQYLKDSGVMDGVGGVVLDAAEGWDSIVGTIKKGAKIVGRAHVGGDGKSMVFVGKTGNIRVQFVSKVDGVLREHLWSEDDAGRLVDSLFNEPANGIAKAVSEAWTKPLVSADGLSALCESRGMSADVFMTIDYAGGKAVTGATLERNGVRATLEWKAGSQSYNLRSIGDRDGEFDAGSSVLSDLLDSFVGWQDAAKERAAVPADNDLTRLEALRKLAPEEREAIRSDDPKIIEKLQAKLNYLVANGEMMRKANKLVRKEDRASLAAMGFTGRTLEALFQKDFAGRTGFADYQMTNNNGVIRTTRLRLEELMSQQAQEAATVAEEVAAANEEQAAATVPAVAANPDAEFLQSMIDGSINLLDPELVTKLEPLFEQYASDVTMMGLLNRAANAYSDAAVAAAKKALGV